MVPRQTRGARAEPTKLTENTEPSLEVIGKLERVAGLCDAMHSLRQELSEIELSSGRENILLAAGPLIAAKLEEYFSPCQLSILGLDASQSNCLSLAGVSTGENSREAFKLGPEIFALILENDTLEIDLENVDREASQFLAELGRFFDEISERVASPNWATSEMVSLRRLVLPLKSESSLFGALFILLSEPHHDDALKFLRFCADELSLRLEISFLRDSRAPVSDRQISSVPEGYLPPTAHDLTRQLLLERQSRQIIAKLYGSLDSDSVLQTLVDSLGLALNCQRAIVARLPENSHHAIPGVSHEFAEPSISPLGLGRMTQLPRKIYGLLQSGVSPIPDVSSLKTSSSIPADEIDDLLHNGVNSLVGAPLIFRENFFGVLVCIESDNIRHWQAHEVDLLRLCAHHAAVSLSHCRQYQMLKDHILSAEVVRNLAEQLNRTLQTANSIKPAAPKKETRTQSVNLSSRELEVLRLIATGLANKEIANQLFLTESTVELHASRIRKKLKLRSRTALVKYACDNDLV